MIMIEILNHSRKEARGMVVCQGCGEVILTAKELSACKEDIDGCVEATCPKCGKVVRIKIGRGKLTKKFFRKKSIACPSCGYKRIGDAFEGTKYEAFPEEKIPDGWVPDFFHKCPKCKREIGIRKI